MPLTRELRERVLSNETVRAWISKRAYELHQLGGYEHGRATEDWRNAEGELLALASLFEEVFRSIGAYLDQKGMKDVLVMEAPDGFIVQALASVGGNQSAWSESMGQVEKETMTFADEDIAKFMDEAIARRGKVPGVDPPPPPAGRYERAMRVIGRYIDEQHPKDAFFFEQDGAFVLRLHHTTQAGSRHMLAEFTREDVDSLVSQGPTLRMPIKPTESPKTASS